MPSSLWYRETYGDKRPYVKFIRDMRLSYYQEDSGLSLRFQVAGYLLVVAGEVTSSHGDPPPPPLPRSFWSATSTVSKRHSRPKKAIFIKSTAIIIRFMFPPQKSNLHQEYSYHYQVYDDHVFIKENYNILRHYNNTFLLCVKAR